MSAANRNTIDDIIKSEEDLISLYSELEQKASLENVRMFLDSFTKGHENILSYIREHGIRPERHVRLSNSYRHIHATDHLSWKRQIDLGNLQSVLLFITKSEAESLKTVEKLIGKMKDGKNLDLLERIRNEKAAMAAKADRLYFDLIESKLS